MIEICIRIVNIIGIFCATNATVPQGADCRDYSVAYTTLCYVEDATIIDIFISFYNPAAGGINCDIYGDCGYLGDGTPSDQCPNCLACPIGMYWSYLEFAGETWQCRDHGGAIKPTYREVYTPEGFVTDWFIVVDMLVYGWEGDEPPHLAYSVVEWNYTE